MSSSVVTVPSVTVPIRSRFNSFAIHGSSSNLLVSKNFEQLSFLLYSFASIAMSFGNANALRIHPLSSMTNV